VKQEITDAAELGINLLVLDDGWQDKFGDWNIHTGRFPHGLRFYVDDLNARGIMPGLWIAPLATDSSAVIVAQHPEWLVRDEKGTLLSVSGKRISSVSRATSATTSWPNANPSSNWGSGISSGTA